MKSQIAMSGISLLLKELNIDYKIVTRNDKQNFITFSLKIIILIVYLTLLNKQKGNQ